jgi:hypothetical protein
MPARRATIRDGTGAPVEEAGRLFFTEEQQQHLEDVRKRRSSGRGGATMGRGHQTHHQVTSRVGFR